MVSDKYVAGFFDADGSVMLKWWKQSNHYRFTLQIEFTQRANRDKILVLIADKYKCGTLRDKKGYTFLTFTGNEALRVAEQIHKHSVIKGEYLRYMIDVYKNLRDRYTKEAKKTLETARKRKRKEQNPRVYNFPARQWFSGYVDGDGSLFIRWCKTRERAQCFLAIDTAPWDREGVSLINNVFKGSLSHRSNVSSYRKCLTKQHIEAILKPLAKHCIIKSKQAQTMIEVLRKGKITYQDYLNMKNLNLGVSESCTRND